MKKFSLLFLFVIFFSLKGFPQTEIRFEDKVRINEAIKISQFVSDNIWKGWSKTDFAILFISDSLEYLINHPKPSEDFTQSYFDSYLGAKIYVRKKIFQSNFLATFPAVNGVNTVVVGTPENTGRKSLTWVITLLHEHFHQYQFGYEKYQKALDKLDLKDGDESGMWILNYKFPYEDTVVNKAFNELKTKLVSAYQSINTKSFRKKTAEYLKSKKDFEKIVSKKDSKYLEFQLWQEGIARCTEYDILAYLVKNDYMLSGDFKSLNDYEPIADNYTKRLKRLDEEINKVTLYENQRDCVYSFGAIEGLILNKYMPNWREKYFKNIFSTTKLFTKR
ncbi:MAG: hypothetical protein K1X86_02310 [Ignavibacteria bacterium]|nr:hypothetical protein [Ignavibacteria bacterium]